MTESTGFIIQLCPNDHPPFLEICRVYQAAGESLGYRVLTFFLSPATSSPSTYADVHYVNATDLSKTRVVAKMLEDTVRKGVGDEIPHLTLCHRYRTFRTYCASKLRSGTIVVVAHEFGFFKRAQRRLALKLMSREVKFAGVSQPVCEELSRVVKDPLLFPNGFDWARVADHQLTRSEAASALGVTAEGFTIGVVGRLHPKKQPSLAVAGFREAHTDLPGAQLVFIGDGELGEELASESSGLPVHFAGFIADAPRYYAALDALLIPSGDKEAFGMVAVEAMAAGVPVVAGPAAGPRSVLGDVGYYFNEPTAESVAAALVEVVTAKESGLLDSRIEQGIERVKRDYSIAAIASRLDALISIV